MRLSMPRWSGEQSDEWQLRFIVRQVLRKPHVSPVAPHQLPYTVFLPNDDKPRPREWSLLHCILIFYFLWYNRSFRGLIKEVLDISISLILHSGWIGAITEESSNDLLFFTQVTFVPIFQAPYSKFERVHVLRPDRLICARFARL